MPNTPNEPAPGAHDFIPFLVDRIVRGQCVLLLGTGVAVNPSKPDGPPLAVELARLLADDPDVRKTGLVGDLAQCNVRYVAEVFARAHDRDELDKAAARFYGALANETTDIHRDLATLPFTLCITTSPDAMMANAFWRAGKNPRLSHHNFRRQLGEPPKGTTAEPLVYQLYGSIDDPDSLVLRESDLVDFLVTVVKNEPALPGWMRAQFERKNTEFLFLGFGFQNWYVRVLLHALGVMEAHERPSYAVEDPAFFKHPEFQQTVGFFRRSGGGIKFQEIGWNEFAAQLGAAHERKTPARAAPPADAPLAFLSYASEDEEAVTDLGARLEERGVRVWQDRQRLRGGDRWEQALKHVVGKDVDYFVAAQSAKMASRREGVFFAELRWALGRQERMPDRRRFVIPATLDGCALETLKSEFHIVDVRSDTGVDALADTILDDWKTTRSPSPAAA